MTQPTHTLWVFERPPLGVKGWIKFAAYPSKDEAKEAKARLSKGIAKGRLRVLPIDAPDPTPAGRRS